MRKETDRLWSKLRKQKQNNKNNNGNDNHDNNNNKNESLNCKKSGVTNDKIQQIVVFRTR